MLGQRTQEKREEYFSTYVGESFVESVSVHETLGLVAYSFLHQGIGESPFSNATWVSPNSPQVVWWHSTWSKTTLSVSYFVSNCIDDWSW